MPAQEQALAIRFIQGTNITYKPYLAHLQNSFLGRSNFYPSTLHEQAYHILQQRELDGTATTPKTDGVAFVSSGNDTDSSSYSRNLDHSTCYECGKAGQFANQCPSTSEGSEQHEQQETNLCMDGSKETNNGSGKLSNL